MKNKLYQVDSFTDKPFKGNPAGVMLCDSLPDTEWMQNIAMEMNLSETAFIILNGDSFIIRYFTPLKEVPLCGHATLASAHIIYEQGLKKGGETISLKAKGADLMVDRYDGWIRMNFPEYPLQEMAIPESFKSLIGFQPVETYSSLYDWVVAVAASKADIAQAKPSFERLNAAGLGHLMITARSNRPDTDFVLRCFAPIAGVNEGPVTGSAHCALTPLWSRKLDKTEMNSLQLSVRSGRLRVKLAADNRVEICGKAVTVFESQLSI